MNKLGPRVRVCAATPSSGFKAMVKFDNGTQMEIDLEPYLHGPIFEPIRDNSVLFRSMKIEGGTIAWPGGCDIDPDVLYYGLKPVCMEESESARL